MITIVTDSSAYLKKDEAKSLGVCVIPIQYMANGKSHQESFSDQNEDMEQLLKNNENNTTAHPNMTAFLGCFEEELEKNRAVLCMTMSSRLSGTYSSAYMAAKQIGSEKIMVFDSQLIAGGLYLLINEARKLMNGGASLLEVFQQLPAIRERISIRFSVDDMVPLRKSGRIGFVRMSVGTILNRKPILICKDGAVVSDGVAQGETEIMKRLLAKIQHNTQEAVISYVGENHMATNLYHVIKKTMPHTNVTLQKIGPVLGIHLGLKVIAVSAIATD